MAARKKKKKVKLRKTILKYNTLDTGYRQYKIQPSRVREEEFKALVKRANDRLYKLEKSGLTNISREYREVKHYAMDDPEGKGFIYNVKPKQVRIRFTSSLKGLSGQEKAYLINTVRNFLNAQTSTISGTKKAIKNAFESFTSNNDMSKISNMNQEQYMNIWNAYKDVVEKNKLEHKGYNVFMDLVKNTNFYQLTPAQMRETLSYISNSSSISTAGITADVLSMVEKQHSDYNVTYV